ncbi:unnamed protein product [Arabidopsis halleri]
MNNCQFMDKQQIMDLSSSSSPPSSDFIDLMNNHDDDHQKKQVIGDDGVDSKKEEILPSYDFHPIRPTTAATRLSHSALDLAGSTTTSTATRVHWSASDFKPVSTWGLGSLDSIEPSKLVVSDKGQNVSILSEIIDRTMRKHTDTLLHVMEGVSARLSQLESRTHNLENLVDDLKVSVDNSLGSSDGKIRQLKNILVEVQSGVQLLKDKQEIVEAQLQLSKHQVSKVDQHTKTHSLHVHPTAQSPTPVPMQQMPQFPIITSFPLPPSSAAAPSQPPSSQLPTHFSPQQEPYFPPPPPNQPPQTQTQHQPPYQSPPQHPPPSSGYNPGEQQPYPMQSYPPIPPHQQPPAGSAPSQHFYNPPQPQPSMYDGAGGSNSGFPSGYSSEPYPYSGSPMSSAKPPHLSSSKTGYPQLSNSRPLPHALPMVSAISSGGGSSSPRSENRAPIDDVIDRVTTMGFPRDQVRATVRKLTENGQAVDLNVVLDKLMN